MYLDTHFVSRLTDLLNRMQLLPANATECLQQMAAEGYVFQAQMEAAESIHLHIKVASTDRLPHQELVSSGGLPRHSKPGYIKYAFAGGYNIIFSSIPVTEEEQLGIATKRFPHLDHVGIDMRSEDSRTYDCFRMIPDLAGTMGWPSRRQGGEGNQVSCCHARVNEKWWVYPPAGVFLEFAFGKLAITNGDFGGDLMPADPALQIALPEPTCCCATSASMMEENPVKKNQPVRKPGIFR